MRPVGRSDAGLPTATSEAASIARELGTPLLTPVVLPAEPVDEKGLLDELEAGMGCIVFTALAQACCVTDKYARRRPGRLTARPARTARCRRTTSPTRLGGRRLNEIAQQRGQKLAQLALQWVLRDRRVTSAVIGASSVSSWTRTGSPSRR